VSVPDLAGVRPWSTRTPRTRRGGAAGRAAFRGGHRRPRRRSSAYAAYQRNIVAQYPALKDLHNGVLRPLAGGDLDYLDYLGD